MKNPTEGQFEQIPHDRVPSQIITYSCLKHGNISQYNLCILVWCKNHQLYEHAVEGLNE